MATTPTYEDRSMSLGRVFERAVTAIRTNPVVILGIALLIGAVPGLLMTYFFVQMGLSPSADAVATGAISTSGIIATALVSVLIGMVISAIVQGALTRATISASEGRKASFAESLSTGLRVFLPLIGLSIVFAFGVGLGFVLLIVPGIILLLMWAVAVPALVVERQGIFGALGRSSELTKGARWKILGMLVILLVIYWLFSFVIGLVGLSAYGSDPAAGLSVSSLIGSIVLGTLLNAAWGTLQAALYVELRQWKEGTSVEHLQEVFA